MDQKIGRIQEYVGLLRRIENECLQRFETDPIYRGALLHFLYLMADSCIALAEMMVKYKSLRPPQTYSETFDILGDNRILIFSAHRQSRRCHFHNDHFPLPLLHSGSKCSKRSR
jgi:uncharacterized protein YutE (UPF0331/DUF86 family)